MSDILKRKKIVVQRRQFLFQAEDIFCNHTKPHWATKQWKITNWIPRSDGRFSTLQLNFIEAVLLGGKGSKRLQN
jgi:hypothetical protein